MGSFLTELTAPFTVHMLEIMGSRRKSINIIYKQTVVNVGLDQGCIVNIK